MIIKSLELKDFRNFEKLVMEFSAQTNILSGDNAQGKTNILESLYVSSVSRSHRRSRDKDMIRFGQEEAHIRTVVEKDGDAHQIDLHLRQRQAKGIAVDRIPLKRAADLFGVLNVVFFSPEDLQIIKNAPSCRRNFIDTELCRIDRIYYENLIRYNRVVMQRNSLLKDAQLHPDLLSMLPVWNEQLIRYGSSIISRRELFIRDLSALTAAIHSGLTGGREELILHYSRNTSIDAFAESLAKSQEKDIHMRTTTVGPHRDDMDFAINGVSVRRFGSQGQQRSAALSLKLAEIELLRRQLHDAPVLLLDDVLSELDSSRQNFLLRNIEHVQTIMTCTGLDEFVRGRIRVDRIYSVVNGTVTERSMDPE